MKKKYFILVVMLFILTQLSNAQIKVDTLTNEKVVTLLKAGIEPSLIITKIQTSVTKFDVSTEVLLKLSNDGVPKEVLNAMINPNYLDNDSISIYKKWKKVSQTKNGVIIDISGEYTIQYNIDGTSNSSYTDFKSGKKKEFGGKFELSSDKKSIKTYSDSETSTAEILKLTNKELEIKRIANDGSEYIVLFTNFKE